MTDGGVAEDDEGVPRGEVGREPDPSDSLRTFGAVLQALREHAGYGRTEFAELVNFSRHTVESVELGRRMPDAALVERAEEVLGNTGALLKASKYVTRGRGDVGLAAWFRRWARLERVAVSLCTYECRLVPGLLQSEGYARALFENRLPLLTDEQLEAQVAARMDRQRMLLERPTVSFHFIVEEAVFRRGLGGHEVQRDQLDHVLERAAPRHVTLQVMPTDAEAHACMDGPVQLLETPQRRRLAYSEGQENGRLISDPKEVGLLCHRYDTLRSQALDAKKSRELLERLRGEL
ncbi:helix-turn-helix domain-containing protein [Streptomyces sudanensis]|uniref:helix-turn-helix domain-containing protein n=1 Tax=Streptomyces sudanensis TaxID=436397 RepID=UPI0020CF532A|nr:helix-turn-helix transcriptional regulator [Streptomyces sudanensis]MCP9959200.1 helix-turn-helix transcriptional regulator [Streptomyces sudanensis]MCQ0000342.1 helix-turn-helix transcriptional regulator [Streptomyces sudanensis]